MRRHSFCIILLRACARINENNKVIIYVKGMKYNTSNSHVSLMLAYGAEGNCRANTPSVQKINYFNGGWTEMQWKKAKEIITIWKKLIVSGFLETQASYAIIKQRILQKHPLAKIKVADTTTTRNQSECLRFCLSVKIAYHSLIELCKKAKYAALSSSLCIWNY